MFLQLQEPGCSGDEGNIFKRLNKDRHACSITTKRLRVAMQTGEPVWPSGRALG